MWVAGRVCQYVIDEFVPKFGSDADVMPMGAAATTEMLMTMSKSLERVDKKYPTEHPVKAASSKMITIKKNLGCSIPKLRLEEERVFLLQATNLPTLFQYTLCKSVKCSFPIPPHPTHPTHPPGHINIYENISMPPYPTIQKMM